MPSDYRSHCWVPRACPDEAGRGLQEGFDPAGWLRAGRVRHADIEGVHGAVVRGRAVDSLQKREDPAARLEGHAWSAVLVPVAVREAGRVIRSAVEPGVVYAVAGGDGVARPGVAVNPAVTYERVHRFEAPPRFTPTYRRPHRSPGGRYEVGLLTVTGEDPSLLVQVAAEISGSLDLQSADAVRVGTPAVSVVLALPQQYRATWVDHMAALERVDPRPG